MVFQELSANRFRLDLTRDELENFVRLLGRSVGVAAKQGETTLAQSLVRFAADLGIDPL